MYYSNHRIKICPRSHYYVSYYSLPDIFQIYICWAVNDSFESTELHLQISPLNLGVMDMCVLSPRHDSIRKDTSSYCFCHHGLWLAVSFLITKNSWVTDISGRGGKHHAHGSTQRSKGFILKNTDTPNEFLSHDQSKTTVMCKVRRWVQHPVPLCVEMCL